MDGKKCKKCGEKLEAFDLLPCPTLPSIGLCHDCQVKKIKSTGIDIEKGMISAAKNKQKKEKIVENIKRGKNKKQIKLKI